MPAQPFSMNVEMLTLWPSPKRSSTKMLVIVLDSSRDLNAPPGLIATSRRPERRKVGGVCLYVNER